MCRPDLIIACMVLHTVTGARPSMWHVWHEGHNQIWHTKLFRLSKSHQALEGSEPVCFCVCVSIRSHDDIFYYNSLVLSILGMCVYVCACACVRVRVCECMRKCCDWFQWHHKLYGILFSFFCQGVIFKLHTFKDNTTLTIKLTHTHTLTLTHTHTLRAQYLYTFNTKQ